MLKWRKTCSLGCYRVIALQRDKSVPRNWIIIRLSHHKNILNTHTDTCCSRRHVLWDSSPPSAPITPKFTAKWAERIHTSTACRDPRELWGGEGQGFFPGWTEDGTANRSNQLFQYDHFIVPICHYGTGQTLESRMFCTPHTSMQLEKTMWKALFWLLTSCVVR
jgi:hypothetical protein